MLSTGGNVRDPAWLIRSLVELEKRAIVSRLDNCVDSHGDGERRADNQNCRDTEMMSIWASITG
jgi:hypothetical protein